ncbi:hypothetical protein [Thalassoglobus sp.]|uniref:hypothetical protein n=1 Tax=Thalassoglobus sp. TaxID=2795869 RepID=UPI003AA7E169
MSQIELAQQYLTSADSSFWRWSKSGKEIEWIDGSTIAFREEVLACLRRLQADGFAPFDMIVLMLAVLRSSWGPDTSQIQLLTNAMGAGSKMRSAQWSETLTALERISNLPPELKSSTEAKSELIALVLEKHKLRATPELSDAVIDEVVQGFPYELNHNFEYIKSTGDWIRELRGLCDGIVWVTEETLRFRIETSLAQAPLPVPEIEELETLPKFSFRTFLEQLENDEELAGLAKLTRQLMAVVHLPKQVQDEDDLPLGGVSDISNRGPLDRLLISELANDDDILMTRVALKEALFLRREAAVSNPPQRRMIFLDVGLRMWGVPRLFSTSVALSLAAIIDNDCQMFRARGADVTSVDFTTRDGLMKHLSDLELDVHPGDSLPLFRREIDSSQDEVVYVLGEDVFADEEFRSKLRENCPESYYVATVNRRGRFRMFSYSPRGERLVREALLDLDILFPKESKQVENSLIDESLAHDLPALMRLKKNPLRLSHSVDPKRIVEITSPATGEPSVVLAITHDRRLMWWDVRNRGARQLLAEVPPGEFLCVKIDSEIVYAVIGHKDNHNRCLIWFETRTLECQRFPLDCPRNGLLDVAIHAGMVMLIFPDVVHFFHGTDGAKRKTFPVHDMTWISSRFFLVRNSFIGALSYDGISPRIENLFDIEDKRIPQRIFDSEAANGPVFLFDDGDYFIPPDKFEKGRQSLTYPPTVSEVSLDGSQFVLSNPADPYQCEVVSIAGNHVDTVRAVPGQYFVRYALQSLQQRSLRVKLSNVGVSSGEIIFRNAKGFPYRIGLSSKKERMELQPAKELLPMLNQNFEPFKGSFEGRFQLKQATWNDGSLAILDSRGMLHLRSSDNSIPELSLVLYDPHVSGWCADGTCFGDDYFHIDGCEKVPAETIYENVLKPFVWTLR